MHYEYLTHCLCFYLTKLYVYVINESLKTSLGPFPTWAVVPSNKRTWTKLWQNHCGLATIHHKATNYTDVLIIIFQVI